MFFFLVPNHEHMIRTRHASDNYCRPKCAYGHNYAHVQPYKHRIVWQFQSPPNNLCNKWLWTQFESHYTFCLGMHAKWDGIQKMRAHDRKQAHVLRLSAFAHFGTRSDARICEATATRVHVVCTCRFRWRRAERRYRVECCKKGRR